VEVKVGFKSQLASKDRKKVMRKEDRRKLTDGDVLEKEDDGRDGKLRRHGPNELRREDGPTFRKPDGTVLRMEIE
jgi:hypothetical protein